MVIEILAHEVAALYGEHGHQLLFEHVFKDHQLIKTSLVEEPYFVNHEVDFIYLGALSEKHQFTLLHKLLPYKDRIKELIEKETTFFITGNGLDIFGKFIDYEELGIVDGLQIFDFHTIQRYQPRLNNYILGTFDGLELTAHKTQFSESFYGDHFQNIFFETQQGFGMNRQTNKEGVLYKNFYGTNCIGPFLLLNPLFMKAFLNRLDPTLPMPSNYDTLVAAYYQRLEEFKSGQFYQLTKS